MLIVKHLFTLFIISIVLQDKLNRKDMVSCREYYCYKFQIRENDDSYLLHAGRLGQQYVIDMYIKLETSRLDYYRLEQRQKQMRTDSYRGIIGSIYLTGKIIQQTSARKLFFHLLLLEVRGICVSDI